MKRQRVYFDTQVYSRAVDGRIEPEKLKKSLPSSKCLCVLSPITLYELLNGIARSRGSQGFRKAQEALRLAQRFGGKNMLPFPGRFIAKSVFDVQLKGRFGPADFRNWLLVAIRARNRLQLDSGTVTLPMRSGRHTFGLSSTIIRSAVNRGQVGYLQQISDYLSRVKPDYVQLRQAGVQALFNEPERRRLDKVLASEELKHSFVSGILDLLGLQSDSIAHCKRIADVISALDAVFTHRKFILRQALTTNYNFESDANAYHDMQQLYYLSDPAFLFVTEDQPLRHSIRKSTQANRVISFREFLARR